MYYMEWLFKSIITIISLINIYSLSYYNTYTHTYTHTYIYTYIRTYAHTPIQVYIQTLNVIVSYIGKVFHLIEQKLVKRLLSNCKWLSSLDIHPSGDHVLVGSYDRRVVWFDLDLSSTPYKTLKFHEMAVRNVQFHK